MTLYPDLVVVLHVGEAGGAVLLPGSSRRCSPRRTPRTWLRAVAYDTALVPAAGRVQVKEVLRRDGGTRIELRLRDLAANRTYGAHVHTRPCDELPADAGPHYQDELDPKQPSVDPKYANPENEVWLEVNTNGDGSARSIAVVDGWFREGACSVVLHEAAPSTHEGHAGTA